jgi:dihydropyrimidinase
MKTCIQNGTVVFEDHLEQVDLLLENERISAIGLRGAFQHADTFIDAADCYIFPGFIDIHTHLDDRIGQKYLADTYRTGSQIALQNGITTLCSFITQGQDESLSTAVARAQSKASAHSFCDYLWHLTPARFDHQGWQEIEYWIEKGFITFKFYTTYKEAGLFTAYTDLQDRIRVLALHNGTVFVHCEDDERLNSARQGHVDWRNPLMHARVRPAQAEISAIQQVIEIARKTGARVHIVHVSTAEGVDLIRSATDAQITCETCPQYLFLDESYLSRPNGHRWICSPPLRSQTERQSLWERARCGDIDILATDHCAFTQKDKDDWGTDIRQIPGGVAGIGALTHLAFQLWQSGKKERALLRINQMLSTGPAKIIKKYPQKGALKVGADADLTVINPAGPERDIISSLADCYETFPDMRTVLEMRYVFLRGQLVVRDNLIQIKEPRGACLCTT